MSLLEARAHQIYYGEHVSRTESGGSSQPSRRVASMPIPDRIYVTRRALSAMHDEALRFSAVGGVGENETGGILVGWRLTSENAIVIVEATGPGPNALHAPIEFNPDVETINQQLNELYHRYPHLDYIGTWHKHPREYPGFSTGDVTTAHSNFSDPAYAMQEIVNPILHIKGGNVNFNYYYMSREMADQRQPFIKIEQVEAIEDDNPRTQPPATTSEQLDSELFGNQSGAYQDLQTQLLASIPDRVGAESLELRQAGYNVNVRRDAEHVYLTITTDRAPGITLYLIAQPDAQLTLNTIFADTPQGEQQVPDLVTQSAVARPRPSLRMIADAAFQEIRERSKTTSRPIISNDRPIHNPKTPIDERPNRRTQIQRINVGAVAAVALLGLALWFGMRATPVSNPTATAIAGNETTVALLASARPVLASSSTATISTLGSTASMVLPTTPAVPTPSPTNLPITTLAETATPTVQSTQSITNAWELYIDRRTSAEARESSSPPDDDGAVSAWKRTVEASDALVAEAQNILGTSDQPQFEHLTRVAGPGSWRVDAQLFASIALLRVGAIEEAQQQYLQAIQNMVGVTIEEQTKTNLDLLGTYINSVPENWEIVNSNADTITRAEALKAIINTLSERARNPSNPGQRAGDLLAAIPPTPTPKPAATRTPPPTPPLTPSSGRIIVRMISLEELQSSPQAASCQECNVIITIPEGLTLEIYSDKNAPIEKLSTTKLAGQIEFDQFYSFVLVRDDTRLSISGNTGFQIDRNIYYSITVTLIQ